MRRRFLPFLVLPLLLLPSCDVLFPTGSRSEGGGSGGEEGSSSRKSESLPPLDTSWNPDEESPVSLFEYEIVNAAVGEATSITGWAVPYGEHPYGIHIPDEIEGRPTMMIGHAAFAVHTENGEGEANTLGDGIGNVDLRLHHAILPDTLQVIGSFAFESCAALQEIEFPSSLERIGNMAFYRCASIEEIHVPSSVTYIDHSAFMRMYSLRKTVIEADIDVIRSDLFNQDYALEEVVLPDQVTTIERVAFASCSSLEHIDLPSSLETIGNGAFQGTGLKEIHLPSSLVEIGNFAFAQAPLKEVVIPASVTSIGEMAFADCMELEAVYFEGTKRFGLDFGDNKDVEVVYGYGG